MTDLMLSVKKSLYTCHMSEHVVVMGGLYTIVYQNAWLILARQSQLADRASLSHLSQGLCTCSYISRWQQETGTNFAHSS